MLSGIDVDQCNYDKRTPLHIASTNGTDYILSTFHIILPLPGHLKVVQFLVEKANVTINPVDM